MQRQRPGPSLLPAPGTASGRSAGESEAEGRPVPPEPRHCQARARPTLADGPATRRHDSGGRGPAGAARPADDGGGGVRAGSDAPAGHCRRCQGHLREDGRLVDTDWYVEAEQPKVGLVVDGEKAAASGLAASQVAAVVRMASGGEIVGLLHAESAREDVPIVLRLPRAQTLDDIRALRLHGRAPVAVGELTGTEPTHEKASLYHKNLQPVTYVTADLAGENESPVYAIARMNQAIGAIRLPEGYGLEVFNASQPFDSTRYAIKWDGEWHITIEVFRDLGLSFAAVLVLIYLLVVGWFQSFTIPLIIMAAIPFSLVGIPPAHAAMGAFFTATSMIGFIAGAGIVVRNSIILVDFIELRRKEGLSLEQAVVDAGAVRFRPTALTAAASLLLSRMAVPVLYYMAHRRDARPDAVAANTPVEVAG
ncbi:MAG: efflux RND transporter permease subunit [Acidimicrobiia bacterium]|nr:efflux RND transporter permease subunit [Acidimicrobiia bacterium]